MGEQRQAFEAYYRKRFKDEPGDNWHTRDCWREWKPAWQAATERAAGAREAAKIVEDDCIEHARRFRLVCAGTGEMEAAARLQEWADCREQGYGRSDEVRALLAAEKGAQDAEA